MAKASFCDPKNVVTDPSDFPARFQRRLRGYFDANGEKLQKLVIEMFYKLRN